MRETYGLTKYVSARYRIIVAWRLVIVELDNNSVHLNRVKGGIFGRVSLADERIGPAAALDI